MKHISEIALNYKSPLLKYSRNVFSGSGEDGIIEYLFDLLKIKSGILVEFGAYDGTCLSNTFNILRQYPEFTGLMIEPDNEKFHKLDKLAKKYSNIIAIHKVVDDFDYKDGEKANSIDNILESEGIKNDDLLFMSIDVDGHDYQIFKYMTRYRPKIVCVETVMRYSYPGERLDEGGASLGTMYKLGEEKKYVPVFYNENVFFITQEIVDVTPELQEINKDDLAIFDLLEPKSYLLSGIDENGYIGELHRHISIKYKAFCESFYL